MAIKTINPIELIDNMLAANEDIWNIAVSIGQADEDDMTIKRWRQGDISTRLEKSYGENVLAKYAGEINVNTSTLRQRRNMSNFFPSNSRAVGDNLGYTHYREGMKLGSLDKAIWALEKCSAKGWPVWKFAQLLNRMLGEKKQHESVQGEIVGVSIWDGDSVAIDVIVKDVDWIHSGTKIVIRAK